MLAVPFTAVIFVLWKWTDRKQKMKPRVDEMEMKCQSNNIGPSSLRAV